MVKAHAPDPAQANARVLEAEMAWLQRVIERRLQRYFAPGPAKPWTPIPAPPLPAGGGYYAGFVAHHRFGAVERLALILALAPDLRPSALDLFLIRNKELDRAYGDFGGLNLPRHGGFVPTFETLLFLLADGEFDRRNGLLGLLDTGHAFVRERILDLPETSLSNAEPFGSLPWRLSRDTLFRVLRGQEWLPAGSAEFPAQRLESPLAWEDLVLPAATRQQLAEPIAWLAHRERLGKEFRLKRHLKPGYRCLFHGPPGTGKTLTACLIGQKTQRPVYRINLSQVVSKYIGETEKNLERIFHQAEARDWVLFFDEADSLFGRRTATSSSNDRYANQGTSYLLQRIEDCDNMLILATNLRANLDEAFTRRFDTILYFPMPSVPERLELWQHTLRGLPHGLRKGDMEQLAREFDLSGAVISNVLRYTLLMTLDRGQAKLTLADIHAGIQRELAKEGITADPRKAASRP
jgi:hypothetical protein